MKYKEIRSWSDFFLIEEVTTVHCQLLTHKMVKKHNSFNSNVITGAHKQHKSYKGKKYEFRNFKKQQ